MTVPATTGPGVQIHLRASGSDLEPDQVTDISAVEAVRRYGALAAEIGNDNDRADELEQELTKLVDRLDRFRARLKRQNVKGKTQRKARRLRDRAADAAELAGQLHASATDGWEQALETQAYLEDHYVPVTDTTADMGLTTPSTREHNQEG